MNAYTSILPATDSARLDRMFAEYVAEAEASHAEFMATGERRQREVLASFPAALAEAQRITRETLRDTAKEITEAAERLRALEAKHQAGRETANSVFDRARDRGLLRRDVNEILEAVTLETLGEIA